MKNTGSPSQDQFVADLERKHGKRVHIHRFTDSAEVHGLNKGRRMVVKKQPADFLVTLDGEMFYAEIKSTVKDRISRDCLETGQYAACLRQIAAGGKYYVFVHFIKHSAWYRLPGHLFTQSPPTVKSWSINDLAEYLLQ